MRMRKCLKTFGHLQLNDVPVQFADECLLVARALQVEQLRAHTEQLLVARDLLLLEQTRLRRRDV